ncbi:Hypothetical predicted protein [Xyrichtys novacula]|uniref:Uncharacterized protein n=1 Tax=Xyrichtys novacula TaxID=13765 RepID=A0AAV1F771_XYRNO|nr:Hypothetical predicted protein [Xyrichtys novacula]
MAARRDEGKVRTLGGCRAAEVSSSGFTETQRRQDKVYQGISLFNICYKFQQLRGCNEELLNQQHTPAHMHSCYHSAQSVCLPS